MIKTIPLVIANLKGFMRNWRSILLLLGFPLLLIGTVFLSFSPDGMSKVPVGVIDTASTESVQFIGSTTSFLAVTKYQGLDSCIQDIRRYKKYACVELIAGDTYTVKVHFDNTREPIIWEIVEKIKTAIDFMQAQKSRELAQGVLGKFDSFGEKIGYFQEGVGEADEVINAHIEATDDGIVRLNEAHDELDDTLDQMDSDINTITIKRNSLKSSKDSLYYSSKNKLRYIKSSLDSIPSTDPYSYTISQLKEEVEDVDDLIEGYNDDAEDDFDEVDTKISSYKEKSTKGRQYLVEIDNSAYALTSTKNNLYTYKTKLSGLETELGEMKQSVDDTSELDPDLIVSPIKLKNRPLYVPTLKSRPKSMFDDVFQSVNLISLQTLFPKLLLLIVMFLSLLISTFICLSEINSISNTRISIIRGISFHEFFSTFLSSFFIIVPPILVVLGLGYFIFDLNIPLIPIMIVLILLASTFVMFGMFLSYLVVKESITLLITTFVLMFLLFFSGYILPIERMSPVSKVIAEMSPGKITLDVFNKLTFYAQPFSEAYLDLSMLATWAILAFVAAYLIKTLRNV